MSKIVVLTNSISGSVPASASLDVGELAFNSADSRLFTKNAAGNIVVLNSRAVASTVSASYALTASYALNGGGGGGSSDTASFADRVWAGTFVTGSGSFSDVGVALSDARFLALTQSADLVNERVFTPSSRFTSSDAGPKQPYTLDLSDNMRTSTIGVVIDGGGLPITIGEKVDLQIPFSCSIVSWSFVADRSGSMTMDIWKSTYDAYPPTGSNSIVSASRPFISASVKNRSTGSLGWTTLSIAKNDTLRFYVSASSTITRANLTLELIRL